MLDKVSWEDASDGKMADIPPISVCLTPGWLSWYSHIRRRSSSVSVRRGVEPAVVVKAVLIEAGVIIDSGRVYAGSTDRTGMLAEKRVIIGETNSFAISCGMEAT